MQSLAAEQEGGVSGANRMAILNPAEHIPPGNRATPSEPKLASSELA